MWMGGTWQCLVRLLEGFRSTWKVHGRSYSYTLRRDVRMQDGQNLTDRNKCASARIQTYSRRSCPCMSVAALMPSLSATGEMLLTKRLATKVVVISISSKSSSSRYG